MLAFILVLVRPGFFTTVPRLSLQTSLLMVFSRQLNHRPTLAAGERQTHLAVAVQIGPQGPLTRPGRLIPTLLRRQNPQLYPAAAGRQQLVVAHLLQVLPSLNPGGTTGAGGTVAVVQAEMCRGPVQAQSHATGGPIAHKIMFLPQRSAAGIVEAATGRLGEIHTHPRRRIRRPGHSRIYQHHRPGAAVQRLS